jgi:hypothetical protein
MTQSATSCARARSPLTARRDTGRVDRGLYGISPWPAREPFFPGLACWPGPGPLASPPLGPLCALIASFVLVARSTHGAVLRMSTVTSRRMVRAMCAWPAVPGANGPQAATAARGARGFRCSDSDSDSEPPAREFGHCQLAEPPTLSSPPPRIACDSDLRLPGPHASGRPHCCASAPFATGGAPWQRTSQGGNRSGLGLWKRTKVPTEAD